MITFNQIWDMWCVYDKDTYTYKDQLHQITKFAPKDDTTQIVTGNYGVMVFVFKDLQLEKVTYYEFRERLYIGE